MEASENSAIDYEAHNARLDTSTLPIFTRAQLSRYNGTDQPNLYVAIKGYIYDVTNNKKHYGVGKSYHNFVGKDVGRLLGCNVIKEKVRDGEPARDTWDIIELTEKQLATVDKWTVFFSKRYEIVGLVVDHF